MGRSNKESIPGRTYSEAGGRGERQEKETQNRTGKKWQGHKPANMSKKQILRLSFLMWDSSDKEGYI